MLPDRSLDRHVACAVKLAGVWMPTHGDQMKNEDCEAECVVVRGTRHAIELAPLQHVSAKTYDGIVSGARPNGQLEYF